MGNLGNRKGYFKEDNALGLTEVYSCGDEKLIGGLDTSIKELVRDYLRYMVGSRYSSLNVSKAGYRFEFISCEYDTYNYRLEYNLKNLDNGGTCLVDGEELVEYMKTVGEIIKAYAEEALNELRYCCYVKQAGAVEDYINENYSMVYYVFGVTGIVNHNYKWCNRFIESGMILPKYLREYFYDTIVPSFRQKLYADSLNKVVRGFEGSEREIEFDDNYTRAMYSESVVFIQKMREKISTTYAEQLRLELAGRLNSFIDLYNGLSRNGRTDLHVYANASKQVVYRIKGELGDRLATEKEVKTLVKGLYKSDVYFIDKDKRELLLYFIWACTGEYKLIRAFSMFNNDVDITSEAVWEVLSKAINYLRSYQFLKVDCLELKKGLRPIKQLKGAEDEVINNDLKNRLKAVCKACKDSTNSYDKMAYDIAHKALKFNSILSEKQLNVINRAYENTLKKESDYNKYNSELKNKMESMLEFYSYSKKSFEYKLMNGVLEKKMCSPKQEAIILDWYEEYLKKRNDMLVVEEIGGEEDMGMDGDLFDRSRETLRVKDTYEEDELHFYDEEDTGISGENEYYGNVTYGTGKESLSLSDKAPNMKDELIWEEE